MTASTSTIPEGIAIIGLAGRFPGARDVTEFWRNLTEGREGITRFTDAELAATGYDAAKVRELPGYVGARGVIEKPEWFDRSFFNVPPKEAEVMDPQHRVFMEVAWAALEDAACDPSRFPGLIGVFAGMSNNTYYPYFVRQRRDLLDAVGIVSAVIANEKDFLTTRLAYKLNLRGPALNIQTACSSSLVTVGVGCQNLLDHQCDVALAGGVSITFPQDRGYFYQDGSMTSPDGWCRPFDERANGTVFSSGCGVVVLKRLADAMADGDHIYAVIKGHALNNDGGQKVGFAAPSVNGHTEVISLAQAVAGISPDTISYIEAHGTATPLGDPVEIAGLTQVFREVTDAQQFCAVGSVKGNIGHCDAASGIASLIKMALAFEYGQLPPSLHCEQPNPALHLEDSPFFLNTTLRDWPRSETPRRAGVSSFGVGGTNAHLVLEEAPLPAPAPAGDAPQVIVLSAKSSAALEERAQQLAKHLEERSTSNDSTPSSDASLNVERWTLDVGRSPSLSNVAFTLHEGRQIFSHRRAIVARTAAEAIAALRAPAKLHRDDPRLETAVAFLFPGQGSQYPGMGAQLFAHEPIFREALTQCAEVLRPELGLDLCDLLFSHDVEAAERLRETRFTQPAIYAVSYALARLWQSRGLQPAALVGHSVGEFVAAALAGVFSWEDGARLVALRARLTQELPRGAMLAARLGEEEAAEFLGDSRLAMAAVNSPKLCVISGPFEAIEELEAKLTERSITARRLATSHAFHSPMVEPVVAPLAEALAAIKLSAPQIPIVSSVTGEFLTAEEATDPHYWAHHLRATVRFSAAATRLLADRDYVLLEAGPGQTLSQLIRQNSARAAHHEVAHSIAEEVDERESLAAALGRLWLAGVPLDWRAAHPAREFRRVPLPTYPFERQRYFADLPAGVAMPIATAATDGEAPPEADAASVAGPQAAQTSSASETASPSSSAAVSADFALTRVKQLLTDLSGIDLTDQPGSTSLLDLGFDSLFLSQAALTMTRKFGAKITVRQLLGDLNTLDALAAALPTADTAAAKKTERPAVSDTPLPTPEFKAHGPFRPLQRDLGATLTELQQRWLDGFIARYTARTGGSKRHTQENRAHFADPRAAAGFKQQWKEIVYPIVVNRSAGTSLWDIDGNEWLDLTLSYGAAMLGHQPSFVMDAIREQLGRGFEIGPTSPLAGEVAAMICEMTGMDRAGFCNTGSEAVTGALRAARTVTGRPKIVYFRESYHGIDNEVLGRRAGNAVLPIAPGIPDAAVGDTIILEYGDAQSLTAIAAQANDIAAVIVEPVQSRHPSLQPREFLHQLRALTEQHGIALIFDEIISGFRCHPGGAQAFFGIRADLTTYGKVLGGGLPIGAIAGRAEYMDAFDGGAWQFGDDSFPGAAVTFFAGTFVRHPLALAAARAVLTHLKQHGPSLQQTLADRAGSMIDRINAAFAGTPFTAQRFASNWLVVPAPDFKYTGLLFALLRLRGLHIWENRPCFVSTVHTDAELDRVVAAFEESVAELENAGFFSRTKAAPVSEGAMPITEAQQEIWMVCQQGQTASNSFNETWTLLLDGALDAAALRRGVQGVVDRHESLRSTFSKNGESITVAPSLIVEVPLVDLSTLSQSECEERLATLRAAEGKRTFDLEKGPLVAMQLVRLAADRHALIFNAHHLICDGWSCDVFLNELATLYCGAQSLPAPMTMRDYERFMHELRATPEYAEDTAYWLGQYRTIPASLTLPGDRPYPRQRSFRGASEQVVLPTEFAQMLSRFGAQQGATLFSVLLAGFKTLLFRLSGQGDLSVGVPSAGQNLAGGDHLIGHCVNMLPLRSQLGEEQTFSELLKAVQATVLDAFEHQRVTFGSLLRQLSFSREPGRVPIIPVTFNVDPPLSHLNFAGLQHRLEANPRSAFQFDLGFNCDTTARGFRLICHYNTDLFDATTIRKWLGQYRALLESVAAHPGQPLGKWFAGEAATSSVIPAAWNGVVTPFPADKGVHEVFEAQVKRAPNAVAIEAGGVRATYAELNQRANRLARKLQTLGVERGTCVGISMERSIELIVGILGILKAGGAYVPLDPSYPADRLTLMLADTRASIVLGQREVARRLPRIDARVVEIESIDLATGEDSDLGLPSSGRDSAYVIFTSGSTGIPKGSEILHHGISRLVINTNYVSFQADDVVAQVSNTSFDASTFEIWGALLNGSRLLAIPRGELLSPKGFTDLLRRSGVTILFLTTPLFHQFAREVAGEFGFLRYLVVGGDALDPVAARAVLTSGRAPANFVNGYGPTETTTFAICHRVERVEEDAANVPIGRPIANTQIYLLDASGEPVPPGEPGEIYIGGPGVARGYVNRPEQTAASFVRDPVSKDENARLYCTGDRARWLADGTIEFLGRIDEQLKIRGFRVEPGEIETALRQLRAVDQCKVVAVKNGSADRTLAAYLTVRPGRSLAADEAREFLKARLPEFMVPSAFSILDAFPLNANGKLDLSSLPVATASLPAETPEGTSLERQIAALWGEVLGRNHFSFDDDFFLVGGHSLLAIQLLGKMRERFAVDVPVQQLFETPTISGLAEFVAARLPNATPEKSEYVVMIQRGDASRTPLFLVPGGWGGEVEFLVYGGLARHLDPALPVFGLRARDSNAQALPDRSVEEFAAAFVAEMRAIVPDGPYLLGGECVGGIVAYEMARLLTEMGQEVSLLVLLDTEWPSRESLSEFVTSERQRERHAWWEARVRQPAIRHWKELGKLSLPGKVRYLWQRLNRGVPHRPACARMISERELLTEYPRKLMAHRPKTHATKLTLLVAEEAHRCCGNLGWDTHHPGELEVHVVPGNHDTYIREHAATAAAELRGIIDRASHLLSC